MEKILRSLMDLNDLLYNKTSHNIIIAIWLICIFLKVPYLAAWFSIGLVIWILLLAVRMVQAKFDIKPLVSVWKRDGYLPFLVGLNICVVLSLLSLVIMWMLVQYERDS